MQALARDFRFAVRTLRRRPGFAAGAAATLALGIGASSVMFGVVEAVLLRPLPFPEPHRIVRLEERHPDRRANLTWATFHDVRARAGSLAYVGAFRSYPFNLAGDGPAEPVTAARVSSDFFAALGARPLHGRLFAPEEFAAGGERVTVFGEALWRRFFGGDPDAIGRRVRLDGEPHLVVGVLPERLRFPEEAQVYLPLDEPRAPPLNRRSHLFTTLARLRPGVPLAEARAELAALAVRIGEDTSHQDEGLLGIEASPLRERLTESVRPALWALLGAVGLLLLVSCMNVATLLLARGAQRSRELAIRSALGAGRGRIVRQLLAESLALALLGAVPGVLLAALGSRALVAFLPPDLPRLESVGLDASTVGFALAAVVLAALLSGAWPALHAARLDLRGALATGSAGAAGGGRAGFGRALVVAEVALLVVLLGGAGLLSRSFLALGQVPLGFRTDRVLTFYVSPAGQAYRTDEGTVSFLETARERLAGLPGVERVALANALPTGGLPTTSFAREGKPAEEDRSADVLAVSPEYFRVAGIPVLAGRGIEERDALGAPIVAVLSRLAAESFWPGESPLGRRITLLHWDEPLQAEVVGVVEDVLQHGPAQGAEPAVYFSHRQFSDRVLGWYFLLQSAGDPAALALPARAELHAVDPDQPLAGMRTLEQVMAGALAQRRFNAQLVGIFAALALALVVAGIHGVVARVAEERRREIGIRLALGARPRDVRRQVTGHGLRLTLLGLAVGLPLAALAGRAVAGLLFGVGGADPPTLLAVSAAVVGVGLAAAWSPARRAAAVDPVVALRAD